MEEDNTEPDLQKDSSVESLVEPRRARAIQTRFNGSLRNITARNLKSLSPPPLRRSLSPLASTVHSSLDTITRIGTTIYGSNTSPKHLSKSSQDLARELSNSPDADIAKPANLAKSLVSLLTTASMYNGNIEEIIEEAGYSPEPEVRANNAIAEASDESSSDKSEDDEEVESDKGDSHEKSLDEEDIEDVISQHYPLQRRPTLFELSVERKYTSNGKSIGDSQNRATALHTKLKEAFHISDDDELIGEYSCWLLKDVLLQGHIYLTQSHLMFFAFLPKNDKNKIVMSGNLAVESIPTHRISRYWAVLKSNTLSLYTKSTDLYFPVLTVDLRYALSANVIGDVHVRPQEGPKGTWFKILTETKSYKLQADSSHAARSWVALIKKHIFSSRNKGDCVTVKIPLQNIIDTEATPIFDGAETLRLKVLEGANTFALDDYFFMFFSNGPEIHKTLSTAIENLLESKTKLPDSVIDSTSNLTLHERRGRSNTFPLKKVFARAHSRTVSGSPLGEHHEGHEVPVTEPVVEQFITSPSEETVLSDSEDVTPVGGSPSIVNVSESDEKLAGSPHSPEQSNTKETKLYLPGYSATTKTLSSARSTLGRWTPKMLKSASSMWASNPVHYSEKNSLERGHEDEFLASDSERAEATKRFQDHFSLPETSLLVSSYYAYLNRNVPVYGKVYIGSKELCFRSLLPGFHTKMILPFKDIENCYKEKGFKFGYYGLVVVIHGHEELFFEFSSTVSRDDCEVLLLKQLDKSPTSSDLTSINSDTQLTSSGKLEAAKIRLFEDKIHNESGLDVPIIIEDHPLLSTTLKPSKPYKFFLLTIGSRGDVQPYIALGLGLLKEGHEVTIVTHKEFEDWILNHNLQFKEIAGNPTELMSLMVSHGSMNVGLIKEASTKFRGWITELLQSSWEACQGADILIESPSAMAGIHIAEALGIPYFRAFTMPWTRTRAYPHAFIVPDQKKGGSYNYLTHVLFENIFWKGISGQVNKWRKETLNLPKTNLELLQQNKVPFLYNISPTVVPPPVDYSDWVKVTGYWFLDEALTYTPPQALVDFIAKARSDHKKLVYIGFGSIVVSNPKELTQAVVDAVLQADVRCILNKGWSERLGGSNQIEIELPYEVYNAGALPHDWLFPQIDAAVHHGGSGTTGATLRAGLPTVIKPFFADQFFYANRVEDIGVGISLKKLNVKSLSKALREATTNQRMISKAQSISEGIHKENGVSNAIDAIYRELEYARDLILNKRKTKLTHEEENNLDDNDDDIDVEQLMNNNEISDITTHDIGNNGLNDEGSWLLL